MRTKIKYEKNNKILLASINYIQIQSLKDVLNLGVKNNNNKNSNKLKYKSIFHTKCKISKFIFQTLTSICDTSTTFLKSPGTELNACAIF